MQGLPLSELRIEGVVARPGDPAYEAALGRVFNKASRIFCVPWLELAAFSCYDVYQVGACQGLQARWGEHLFAVVLTPTRHLLDGTVGEARRSGGAVGHQRRCPVHALVSVPFHFIVCVGRRTKSRDEIAPRTGCARHEPHVRRARRLVDGGRDRKEQRGFATTAAGSCRWGRDLAAGRLGNVAFWSLSSRADTLLYWGGRSVIVRV